MKKKTGIYLVIGIIGIALALSARFLLQDCLSDSQSGAMIGIGAGLFVYGIAKGCFGLWGAKNPDLMKINEIEEKRRAKSAYSQQSAGNIRRGAALAVDGRCLGLYFFDAPLWTVLTLVGAFLLKTILDFILMAYYQRKM